MSTARTATMMYCTTASLSAGIFSSRMLLIVASSIPQSRAVQRSEQHKPQRDIHRSAHNLVHPAPGQRLGNQMAHDYQVEEAVHQGEDKDHQHPRDRVIDIDPQPD